MKRIVYLLSFIWIFTCCVKTNVTECAQISEIVITKSTGSGLDYYWYFDQKIFIRPIPEKYLVITRSDSPIIASTKSNNSITNWQPYIIHDNCQRGLDHTSESNYLMAEVDASTKSTYGDDIIYSAPIYETKSGRFGLSNIFHIKLKSLDDEHLIRSFANENNATIIGENIMPLWYTLLCDNNSSGNALELSNKAYESGNFSCCDVEFVNDIKLDAYNYNDSEFYRQWNLHGTYGIDIASVHEITSGSPSVLVAIVDDGVQLDHPDLVVTNSWDANSCTSPGRLYYASGSTKPDSHGMAMAGIIGASTNNSSGIVG